MYHVEYRRPGEAFHRVGSDDGYETIHEASVFFHYSTKGTEWRGTVRLVDGEGKAILSSALEDDYS